MATQEEKELRQKVLDDIKSKRAAAAQAEGSLGAAERGDYGNVGQGEKGPFDDEINQDPANKMSNFDMLKNIFMDPRTSMFGAGVDLLGRTGAFMAPVTQKPLEKISEGGDSILDKAGQFFYEDAAKATKKINEGVKFDDLTFSEKFALASVPAELIPGLGLAPDVLKAVRNFAVNTGRLAKEGIEGLMQPSAVTDTGMVVPMDEGITSLRVSDEGASGSTKVDNYNLVNSVPQESVTKRIKAQQGPATRSEKDQPDLSKLETVGKDGEVYVNIYGKVVPKKDTVLNESVLTKDGEPFKIRYNYILKSGKDVFSNPDQDNFLLRVIRKRLDEGRPYNTVRGSLLEYIKENPNLLKEAEELGVINFSKDKIADRLKIIFSSSRGAKNLTEESSNLRNEILEFKPDQADKTMFLNFLRGDEKINKIISANKEINKGSLYRYLDFIRKSSPTTRRGVGGKFKNFIDEFNLELDDLNNTNSLFYKQYEYFKTFDKVRTQAGKKINPFLEKAFPTKSGDTFANNLQIAHRFENKQIGKTVGEGLEGAGATPSAYYLDIGVFNAGLQPRIEEQLRIALAKNDVPALKELNKTLTEDLGAEVVINNVKFGKHRTVEEKLLKELKKYETDPELMKKMGITREMLDDVYKGLDIISQGASKLNIKTMAGGGLATMEYMTRPLDGQR